MTLNENNFNEIMQLIEVIHGKSPSDAFREILEITLNRVMEAERAKFIGASAYERTEERRGYANGYKDKTFNTGVGALSLKVPQTRDSEFYPSMLEKGLRSDRALKAAVAEMYLKGVSTRKVAAITKELCGVDFTSAQVSRLTQELDEEFHDFRERELGIFPYLIVDAIYLKVRQGGKIVSIAILIAYGVNECGKREIIGVSGEPSEAEVHWRNFFTGLQKRGLSGVKLIVSDDHVGLKAARQRAFPAIPWQRCQFHMSQNAQSYSPRKSMRTDLAQGLREVFNSPSYEEAKERISLVSERFEKSAPAFSRWLDKNAEEGLAIFDLPAKHQRRLRTSNGIERVNKEIKRRTKVVGVFPNIESAVRLVTGILIEINEGWTTGKLYLDMQAE